MKSTLDSAYALPDVEVVVVYAGEEIPIDAKPYDPPPPIPPTPLAPNRQDNNEQQPAKAGFFTPDIGIRHD